MDYRIFYLQFPKELQTPDENYALTMNIEIYNLWNLIPEAIGKGIYKYIGSIELESIEQVYERLQNDYYSDGSYYSNGHPLHDRSMMIGDLAMNMRNQRVYVCASVGFDELDVTIAAMLQKLSDASPDASIDDLMARTDEEKARAQAERDSFEV